MLPENNSWPPPELEKWLIRFLKVFFAAITLFLSYKFLQQFLGMQLNTPIFRGAGMQVQSVEVSLFLIVFGVGFTTLAAYWGLNAWSKTPDQYLDCLREKKGELSFGFHQRDPSPRWKEITEPYPYRFAHHMELYSVEDIDDKVRGWLQAA
jgi:hypothetical protein